MMKLKHSLLLLVSAALSSTSFAQSATPRPGGGLNVTCPSGRSASVVQQGTSVMVNIREPNGQTWGTSEEPSSGSSDPQNKIGDPKSWAERVCRM